MTIFERGGKALECGVEHRPHQHRQHPASEFVGQEKSDVTVGFGFRLEHPAVFQVAERALEILDHDLQIRPVQRYPAGKGFTYQLERHGHVGDHDLGTVFLRGALTDLQRLAQRHEFRITLDIGDQIEHLRRGMANPALAGKARH